MHASIPGSFQFGEVSSLRWTKERSYRYLTKNRYRSSPVFTGCLSIWSIDFSGAKMMTRQTKNIPRAPFLPESLLSPDNTTVNHVYWFAHHNLNGETTIYRIPAGKKGFEIFTADSKSIKLFKVYFRIFFFSFYFAG